ncbi:MAG: hypothetical protein JSS66_02150 [Armatimonadetes bacterium]|nr:hypothetical protein [Armatimonadota bacterium]
MKTETETPSQVARDLLRRAATIGPGLRGHRTPVPEEERNGVLRQFQDAGIEPPAFLNQDIEWADRKAKLFEAGEYPDKGLTVTASALRDLAENFDLPVPILIEHAKSPLEIGYLTDVQADGDELFGTIALTRQANDLIEASGAHALSLGLDPSLLQIREVSLVRKPRVASARLFTGEFLNEPVDWKGKYEQLLAESESKGAHARLDELVASGRLLPAQLPFAKALLAAPTLVEFDGDSVPVASLVLSLVESGPVHGLFGETAPHRPSLAPSLDPEHRAFYDRYFAGLSLEEIAKNRAG